jgi:protein phosphatase methylesterase 1
MRQKQDFVAVPWNKHFTECRKVQVDDNEFNVYLRGNTGPLLVLLHGGGYSGLTWALFAVRHKNYFVEEFAITSER